MIETLILAGAGIFAGSAFLIVNARLSRVEYAVDTMPARVKALQTIREELATNTQAVMDRFHQRFPRGENSIGLEEAAKLINKENTTND